MEVNLKLKLKDEEELDSSGSKKEPKISNLSDVRCIVAFLELELLSDGKFTQVSSFYSWRTISSEKGECGHGAWYI